MEPYVLVYRGQPVQTTGILQSKFGFSGPVTGTLSSFRVDIDVAGGGGLENFSGSAYFGVNIAGAPVLSGAERAEINSGQLSVTITGLSEAITIGDWIEPYLDTAPTTGKINGPVTFTFFIDDGISNPWKESVRAATTTNGTLATAYENGDTIDGVVLATGNRILLKNQTAGAENGIYTVNATGAPTRATDADTATKILGTFVAVQEGTANADKLFQLTTNAPITLGTTALTFTEFTTSLTTASTTEVLTGTDTAKAVTPDSLAAIWEKGSDIASAGTISIGEGGYFHVTGTTTITDIDPATDKAGRAFALVFDGILTLTHHSTTLILPTGASITTAAGDVAVFRSEGSDAVKCVSYQRADGTALAGSGGSVATDAIWDAKGDLAVGTGANTAAKLTVGTDGQIIRALASEATGLDWTNFPDASLYVVDYASVQAAMTAFAASSTAKRLVFPSNGAYTITATVTLDDCDNKIIEGNGATITASGGATIYCLDITNSVGLQIQNLNFVSANPGNTHIGIRWNSTTNESKALFCRFTDMYQAIQYAGTNRNWAIGCVVDNASNIGMSLTGEYFTIQACTFKNCDNEAVKIAGGNNYVLNSQFHSNAIGIFVDSNGVANGDHGLIANNSINHQTKCGIYLKDLAFSMKVIANDIWATTGANLGSSPQDSSFGIYCKNVTGVKIADNDINRNKFNLAIEGLVRSALLDNTFLSDNTLTTNHIKEVGGTNNTYRIGGNTIGSAALVGAEKHIDCPGAVFDDPPLCIAASDETTALTTGTAKVTFRMPYAMTVTAVRATLSTAQTSGSIFTVDINEAGTSILSTKITIDNTEKTSTTAATAPVISDSTLADDAEITIDIDQVGDGTAKGLKVWLIGYKSV